MARYIFFAILLVSLFYLLEANPVPQDVQQQASNTLDHFADQVKKAWSGAADTIQEKMGQWMNDTNIGDAFERAKSFINQAGDNIRKEAEKIGERMQE